MSESTPKGHTILKEAKFETPKKTNLSNKKIADSTLEEINNFGVTIEQIEGLGVPVLKYKTQITLHGVFDTDKIDGYRSTGYKSMIVNANKTLGVRYVAIDADKKSWIKTAIYLDKLRDRKKGWTLFKDSQGWTLQKKVSTIDEVKEIAKDFPADLIGGQLTYFYAQVSWLNPKPFFVLQTTLSYIYQKDLDTVIAYFSNFSSKSEVEQAEKDENEAQKAAQKAAEQRIKEQNAADEKAEKYAIERAKESTLNDLKRMGLDPENGSYDKNLIKLANALGGNKSLISMSHKENREFSGSVSLKDLKIAKPFRLVIAAWGNNYNRNYDEYRQIGFTIVEFYISQKNYYKRYVGYEDVWQSTSLSQFAERSRKDMLRDLKRWVCCPNNTLLFVLPDFGGSANQEENSSTEKTSYAATAERFFELCKVQGKNVLIPRCSSNLYLQMLELAKSHEGKYEKDPPKFMFPSEAAAQNFLTGSTGEIKKPTQITDYAQALKSLTQDGQIIKYPSLSSEVWVLLNGQAKANGGYYDKYGSKGFKFKNEQAASNFMRIVQPQQVELNESDFKPITDKGWAALSMKLYHLHAQALERLDKIKNLP